MKTKFEIRILSGYTIPINKLSHILNVRLCTVLPCCKLATTLFLRIIYRNILEMHLHPCILIKLCRFVALIKSSPLVL